LSVRGYVAMFVFIAGYCYCWVSLRWQECVCVLSDTVTQLIVCVCGLFALLTFYVELKDDDLFLQNSDAVSRVLGNNKAGHKCNTKSSSSSSWACPRLKCSHFHCSSSVLDPRHISVWRPIQNCGVVSLHSFNEWSQVWPGHLLQHTWVDQHLERIESFSHFQVHIGITKVEKNTWKLTAAL